MIRYVKKLTDKLLFYMSTPTPENSQGGGAPISLTGTVQSGPYKGYKYLIYRDSFGNYAAEATLYYPSGPNAGMEFYVLTSSLLPFLSQSTSATVGRNDDGTVSTPLVTSSTSKQSALPSLSSIVSNVAAALAPAPASKTVTYVEAAPAYVPNKPSTPSTNPISNALSNLGSSTPSLAILAAIVAAAIVLIAVL